MLIDGTGNVSVYNTPSSNNHVANKAYVDNSIPIGGIIMWSGTIATIPVNWRLCNGGTFNGRTTPDLTNKFIVGVSTDSNGTPYTTITGSNTQTGGDKNAVVVKHKHGGYTNNGTNDGGHEHTVSGKCNMLSYDGFMLIYTGANIDVHTNTHNRPYSIPLSEGKAASSGSEHRHIISEDGESGTDKNLPPYYALAFIMRVF